ncbi:excinuclease ABC subunit UvrC [Roseivirga sp. BDSF3-8]|uniref:excinuclease ABC subunit UvrC n=1 Tax=Roseivirga sp. BDSF3-8 TaxID=3241598 RepID=UPI00353228CA
MEVPNYTPDQVNNLPDEPGVYRFYNKNRTLIYVGKAKSLKKRVSSYFVKNTGVNRKTLRMVSEIRSLEVTLVNSEFDALLLENNLIKEHQPKYNILLKDDKTYPYICISNERFPRIYATRTVIPSEGTYFGPYASVKAMNNVLDLIRNIYTIRTCKYNLSEENIQKEKYKVCLEFHIGNCQGPCEGLQKEEDYDQDILQCRDILKGHLTIVKNAFKEEMLKASEKLAFERAQRFKEKLDLLEKFQTKSTVVNQKISDVDVFTIVSDEKYAFVNYLKVKDGTIIMTKTVEIKKKLEEENEDILSLVVLELRDRYRSQSKEIITNLPIELGYDDHENVVPKIGDKKKLIELSIKNALFYKKEKYLAMSPGETREDRILKTLQHDLQLKTVPRHIECFDNSNLQGSNPVASMVCFKNGKPSKKEYRHYHIKTVIGPNDFASMEEIVTRRYRRLKDEAAPLPDLVVIDGGKGQLSAAVTALKNLEVYGEIPVVGIAKRLEEIYFPEDPYPLHIDKKSESLALLQRVRDEAHRFAITFHRKTRSKKSFKTELEEIEGVGKTTADKLLKHFKSVKKVREANVEELSAIVGSDKAGRIRSYFSKSV